MRNGSTQECGTAEPGVMRPFCIDGAVVHEWELVSARVADAVE